MALLNARSYRNWLDTNAVAWVAVPTAPGTSYQAEASLIHAGLPYLREIWRDDQWTLFGVASAEPIIPAPATVVRSSETQVVFTLDRPATLVLRLRPARFIHVVNSVATGAPVCLTSRSPDEIEATFTAPGQYVLTSSLSMMSSVKNTGC
jgi:hypothetical protein